MRTVLGSKFLKVSAAVLGTVAVICCAIFCCLNLFDDKNTQTAAAEATQTVAEGEPVAQADDRVITYYELDGTDNLNTWNKAIQTSIDGATGSVGLLVTVRLTANWNFTTFSAGAVGVYKAGDSSVGCLQVPAKANILLDLNGYNLARTLTAANADGTVMLVTGGGIMEVMGDGEISGGWENYDGGAGFVVNVGARLTLSGGTITNNRCTVYGGGVLVSGGALTVDGAIISGNTAGTNGGGICVLGNSTLNIKSGTIASNNAVHGAGVYASGANVTINMSGGYVMGNNASGNGGGDTSGGGGFQIVGCKMTFEGGTISNNIVANGRGGGINFNTKATLTINGGTIADNSASCSAEYTVGGGIRGYDSTLYMYGGTISGNSVSGSSADAGGIGLKSSTFEMYGGTVRENKTMTDSGGWSGGMETWYSTITIYDGEFINNYSNSNAGGINFYSDTTAVIYGGRFANNTSRNEGGAIYVLNTATLTLYGGTITGNRCGSAYGGGIRSTGSNITIGSKTVTKNGKTYGGGLKIYDNVANDTRNNICLPANSKIAIDGSLKGGNNAVSVGVTTQSVPTATAPVTFIDSYDATTAGGLLTTFFFADNKEYKIQGTTNGQIALGTAPAAITWNSSFSINKGERWLSTPMYGKEYTQVYNGNWYSITASAGTVTTSTTGKFLTYTSGSTNITYFKDVGVYTFVVNDANYANNVFTFEITKRAVTISWSEQDLYYTAGKKQYPAAVVGGIVSGDDCKLTVDSTNAGINAGTYTVTAGLSGANVANYELPSDGSYIKTYSILPRKLSKPYINGGLTYDGNALQVIGGYDPSGMTISYDANSPAVTGNVYGINAGTYNATIRLLDPTNFRWEDNTTSIVYLSSIVNKVVLSVSGISLASKAYDGTAKTTLSMDVNVLGVVAKDYSGANVDKTKIWVEPVGAASGEVTLTGSDVGQYSKKISLQLTGSMKDNYMLLSGEYECVCNITKAQIEITGGIVVKTVDGLAGKIYDGNTNVTLDTSGVTFKNNSHSGVAVTNVGVTANGAYSSSNAGNAVAVSFWGFVLTGTNAKNYDLDIDKSIQNLGTSVTGKITKREVQVSVSPVGCDYGGTPTINYTVTGAVAGDDVKLEFAYTDPTDATNTPVAVADLQAGTYTVTPSLTSAFAGNYTIQGAPTGSVTIAQKTVLASGVSLKSKEYDGTTNIPAGSLNAGYSISGLINGDTTANVELDIDVSGCTFDTADVGYHSITVTIALTSTDGHHANYKLGSTSLDVGVYITPAPLTITDVTAQKKTYDGTNSAVLTVTFSGKKLSTDDVSIKADGAFDGSSAGTGKTVNVYSYYLDGPAKGNYEIDAASRKNSINTGEIEQRNVSVAISSNKVKYGNVPVVTYTVTNAIAGDDVKMTLTYDHDTTHDTVLKNVGTYTVTATLAGIYATNYKISGSNTDTVEIERATLTLSVNNTRVEYGQTLPANSVTASGFMYQDAADATLTAAINSGLTYVYYDKTNTNTVATPTVADEYIIKIDFGGASTLNVGDNYIINLSETTNGKLVIFGMGGISVTITSDSLVYGTYDASTYSIGHTVTAANGATLTLEDLGIELEVQGTVKDVATYKITYNVTDNAKFANYDVTVFDGTLTITQATLTVTGVTAASKTYDGNSTATLTVAFTGAVGSDDVTITAAGAFADTKAGTNKTVNIYSYALGGTTMGNYEIDGATLLTSIATGEIEQKEVTVSITAVTATYGNVPEVKYTVTGAVAGEDIKLALAYDHTTTHDTELKNVGTYAVAATLDGDFATNYKISGGSATGTVTIERAVLTLTVNNQRYEYGATIDKPTVTVSGYKYGDATDATVQAAIDALTYRYYRNTTLANPPKAVGEYDIKVNYGSNSTMPVGANYVVNTADIKDGKLVIYGMGGITVTVTSDTLVYGVYTSAYAVQSTVSDNTLTLADLGIELYVDGTVKDVATYKMTYRVTDAAKFANYDVTVLDGILTITKAPLTVTVGTNASRAYGTEASVITGAATATATGLVYTDTFNKSEVTFTTNYVKFAGIGEYDVFASNWTNTAAKNYEISYVSGKVEITPYALTVTVDNKTSVYGDELVKLTYTGTPLNNDNLGIMLAVKPHAGETDVRNVGTYVISGEATNANYDVTVTDGTYTITKATLTAKPLDAEIAYGAALPHGVKISGYKYADESDKTLTSQIEGSSLFHFTHYEYDETDNTTKVNVDAHTVEAGKTYYMVLSLTGTLETDNYKVVIELDGSDPVEGTFEVFGQALVVIISNVSAQYGKDVDLNALGTNYYKVTDLNGVEQTGISDLDITLKVYSDENTEADLNADGNYDVGKYLIIGSKNNNNYSIQFVSGNYTVYPYEVEVVWTKDGVDLAASDVAEFTFEAGVKQGLGAYDKNDGTITLTVTDGEIDAGVYYAGVSLPNANYIFKNAQDVTRKFEIKQLELEVVWKAKVFATGADIPADGASGKFAIPYSAGNSQSPYPTFVLASDGTTAVNLTSGEYFVKGGAVEYGLNYVAEVMLPTGNYKIVGNATQYFDITKISAAISWSVGSATTVGADNSCTYIYTGAAYVPTATSGEVDLDSNELHFTVFAVVDGVEGNTPLGGAVSEVGTYRVYVSTSNNNYLIASANDHYDFEIEAQVVTVTWSSNSFTYNGLAQAPEAYFTYLTEIGNASSAVNVPLAVAVDGAHTDKGTYTAKITLSNANFVLSDGMAEEEYTYDISERNIEIKWTLNGTELTVVEDKEEEYDGDEVETGLTAALKDGAGITAANVPLKYSVTRRESATATAVDWTGKPIKDFGIYTLTVSLDKDSAAAANFKIVGGNWQLTVTKVAGVELIAQNISYALNQLETEVPLTADVTGLVAGDKADDGTDLIDALINADKTIAFNWLISSYVKGTPMGTYSDYANSITLNQNNTAVYTKLKDLLKNYEWTFTAGSYEVYYNGSDIFFYLMGDSKQSANFVYDGSGRLPKAYYVKDGVTKELEVAYVADDGQVSADKPVNAGEYTVRVYKNPDENLPVKDLDGTLLDNYIEKQFTITKRDIYVNVSDGKEVYGNVSSSNLESKLTRLLMPDYVRGKIPAYNSVSGERDDLKLKLISYDPAADENDILLNITENFINVGEYYLVGDWDEQTFGNNYTVTFEYANADHAVYTVEEASIYVNKTGTQWLEEWFNEAQQFDRYRSQFITLNKKTDGVYDNIVYQGNQSAAVKIYYSNRIYDMTSGTAIPDPEDEEKNGYSDLLLPIVDSGKFVINYKIEIPNHETLYGKWTVLILPEGNFVKVLFVKEYTVSYGDEPLDREELVAALVDGGYLNISGMEMDYFKNHAYAYVPMGNGRYADAKTNIGQYTITFELHDIDKNTEFEIMYREDIAEPDRNIGKYVVDRRLLTVEWGETAFEYDGNAHMPEITISGWATSESVKIENLAGDDKHFTEVYDNGARTVITVSTYGNFTAAGEVHRATIETDNPNYRIEAASASNAVSIRMPDPEPVIVNAGLPKWAWYVIGVAAAAVVLTIIILAAKLNKRKQGVAGGGDDDGFYDNYTS